MAFRGGATVLLLAMCLMHLKGSTSGGQESESIGYGDAEHASRTRLTVNLMSMYHPLIIPMTPVNVTYDLQILRIDGVNEKENVIRIAAYAQVMWFDHRFQWDPSGFNGIRVVTLPANKIWRPNIRPDAQVLEADEVNLNVYSDGTIYHLQPMRLAIPCQLQLTNYPFDSQTCRLNVEPWDYDITMVNLISRTGSQEVNLNEYQPHPQWAIESTAAHKNVIHYMCCDESFSSLTFKIQIKRQEAGYAARVLAPSVATSLLLLLCFLMPPGSGERILLCSVLLLCILLQIFQLNMTVPLGGPGSPYLGDFLCFSVFLAFFAAIESVLVFNLSRGTWGGGPGNSGRCDDGEGFGVQVEQKTGMPRIARFIDVGCFVVFTFIFAIGGGVILNPHTQ